MATLEEILARRNTQNSPQPKPSFMAQLGSRFTSPQPYAIPNPLANENASIQPQAIDLERVMDGNIFPSAPTVAPQVPAMTQPSTIAQPRMTPPAAIPTGDVNSPQRNFAEFMTRGEEMTPEKIAQANTLAKSMGTTFDPATGYSRQPFQDVPKPNQIYGSFAGYTTPEGNYQGTHEGKLESSERWLSEYKDWGITAKELADVYSEGADLRSASSGVPMTGMRPIDPTTGQPMSEQAIAAAKRAGLELPTASVPMPQTQQQGAANAPMSVADTQAELMRRFGAPTVSGNMNPPSMGLETDPQGRMIPAGFETRADAFSGYEQAAAEREKRAAEQFGKTRGPDSRDRDRRGTMSMADATELTGGDRDAARALLKRQELGLGEFAQPKDTRTPEQIEAERLDIERKRQIIEQGRQPDATPEQKKSAARQQAVETGTITQSQADEANKQDLLGKPPIGYDTWADYESRTGVDADGDGRIATKGEAAEAESGDVLMIGTDGKTRKVPAKDKEAALKAGYTLK